MEVSEPNELEVSERNNRVPQLHIMFLKFLAYFTMYLIVPLYLFDPGAQVLASFIRPVIHIYEIRFLVFIVVTYIAYKLYKVFLSVLFDRLQFDLKNEWINYLTIKGKKISYYKTIIPEIEAFNDLHAFIFVIMDNIVSILIRLAVLLVIALTILVYFLTCSVIWAHYQESIFGFNIWKSEIFFNYVKNLNTDLSNLIIFFLYSSLLTTAALFLLGYFIIFIVLSILKCMFPLRNNALDGSDISISFITKSIDELKAFEFSDNFEQMQKKKIQIIELINFALDHGIKVDNRRDGANFLNVSFALLANQYNELVLRDILFRTNGLYKKINNLCVEINNMNSPEERDRIVHDLKIYLKVIENRDFSKIEPVEYEIKKSNLTSSILKVIAFLNKIL